MQLLWSECGINTRVKADFWVVFSAKVFETINIFLSPLGRGWGEFL